LSAVVVINLFFNRSSLRWFTVESIPWRLFLSSEAASTSHPLLSVLSFPHPPDAYSPEGVCNSPGAERPI
jgi:hypothetical protein